MGRPRLVRAPRVVVAPMLASSLAPREPPPEGPAWTFEPKLDGVRAVAVIGGDSPGDVSLFSRNGIPSDEAMRNVIRLVRESRKNAPDVGIADVADWSFARKAQ